MEYTQSMLADLAGYSVRRLQQIDKQLPAEEKLFVLKKQGGYDGRIFVENWVKYQLSKELPDDKRLDLEQVKAQHELLKMDKTRIEIRERMGELVNASDVLMVWSEIVTAFRNGLLHIGSTLAPRLAGVKKPEIIKTMIEESIRSKLKEIVECKLPTTEYSYTEDDIDD